MLESRTLTISIHRNWRDLYEEIWRPEVFPTWAAGLSEANLHRDGEVWKAQGPGGPVTIRFTGHNLFGIMDHYVDTGSGPTVYVPLRIIANGDGADVQLTLFRQPEMSDEAYQKDADSIERDLLALERRSVSA
jgi:hypothetical protein